MDTTGISLSPCVLLTATVQVNQDMCFTVRRDASTRYADYKSAFRHWVETPAVSSIVLIENSGFDLSELAEMAKGFPDKQIELLSFSCPPFDGSLGKGYGEMLCLQHCLAHSRLLNASPSFMKVTGRYYLRNVGAMLGFIAAHPEVDVVCNLVANLSWADSRAFGGTTDFLRNYLCPMLGELNDTKGSAFEHVLARAAHRVMADRRVWRLLPEAMEIEGFSGSLGHPWTPSTVSRLKQKIKHRLFQWLLRQLP